MNYLQHAFSLIALEHEARRTDPFGTQPAFLRKDAWHYICARNPLRKDAWHYIWRQQYFGTTANTGTAADLADANGDGIVNKLEFFLARNPLAQNPPSSLPTLVRNGATLEYTYTRSLSAMSQLTHAVEWSDTLAAGSWSSAGVTEQILSDNGTVQQGQCQHPNRQQ